jgi:leucyl aminopeptidase
MINTPANDMGPRQIESIAREIAGQYGAQITVIEGEGLLEANYPAVHAVGRAAVAARAPRIIEMTWGERDKPVIALVGKGVVFDTGGLDIKPSSGMRLMKKDMGGAAHALALGRMIMAAGLPVRLAVLTPVVENAISGDAMRPGDVIGSRKGLTIEIGNTDAEGRLILADALTRAAELEPALTLDLATLTGAARAALGPQLPPFFTDDDDLAAAIARHAEAQGDPLWRLPLWKGYAEALDSDVADLKNDPDAWAQAGAVTAALFLQRFAPPGPWAHFDIFGWNPKAASGQPSGGEAQAIRALYAMLRERFAGASIPASRPCATGSPRAGWKACSPPRSISIRNRCAARFPPRPCAGRRTRLPNRWTSCCSARSSRRSRRRAASSGARPGATAMSVSSRPRPWRRRARSRPIGSPPSAPTPSPVPASRPRPAGRSR